MRIKTVSSAASRPDAELMALIDRIGHQDEAALRRLYDISAPRLMGLAMRVVRQREWAEDVLQETFLAIWRLAGDYRATLSPPMAWMALIVRSRSIDLLRRHRAERNPLMQELDDATDELPAADAVNPMDATDASEQARALHRCLAQLESRHREVVSLAYLRDLSHSDLAHELCLPLGTVKTWIRRGLDVLRNCMQQFV